MVLKKYVPGITHDQLCTVANWNPQLSKDFLHCGCPLKSIYPSQQGVALAPCVCPSVPLCPPLRVSKLLPTVLCSRLLYMTCSCHAAPTLAVGHCNRTLSSLLQFSYSGMRSVFQLCTWPLEVRHCSHSQKDNHGELHFTLCIFNSPTLRLSWTQVRSAQRADQ